MRHETAGGDIGLRPAIGFRFLFGRQAQEIERIFHFANLSPAARHFHFPVSIQLSMRRIGSSHSQTIPVTR